MRCVFAVLLAIGASLLDPQAPRPAAPAPAPAAPVAETAGSATNELADEPQQPAEWAGCLFSKAELEATTHDKVTIAPDGGFVLGLALVEREQSSSHSFVTWIGLAKQPQPGKPFAIKAVLDDSNRELEGGIDTSYEIHGSGTPSANGSSYDITLASTQQPHMFDPDSPLAHFTVTVKRAHVAADCVYN